MLLLSCKNVSTECTGTIEDYLSLERIPYTIVGLLMRELIFDMNSYDSLVMLGGPMSGNGDLLLFTSREEDLVRDFAANRRNIVGIYHAARIMANALRAKGYKGSALGGGWDDIIPIEDGSTDSLMRGLGVYPRGDCLGYFTGMERLLTFLPMLFVWIMPNYIPISLQGWREGVPRSVSH